MHFLWKIIKIIFAIVLAGIFIAVSWWLYGYHLYRETQKVLLQDPVFLSRYDHAEFAAYPWCYTIELFGVHRSITYRINVKGRQLDLMIDLTVMEQKKGEYLFELKQAL